MHPALRLRAIPSVPGIGSEPRDASLFSADEDHRQPRCLSSHTLLLPFTSPPYLHDSDCLMAVTAPFCNSRRRADRIAAATTMTLHDPRMHARTHALCCNLSIFTLRPTDLPPPHHAPLFPSSPSVSRFPFRSCSFVSSLPPNTRAGHVAVCRAEREQGREERAAAVMMAIWTNAVLLLY